MRPTPGRLFTLLTAVGLAAVGGLFIVGLVANSEDNAYVGLYLLGVGLAASSVPFLLATVLPEVMRRWALVVALVLFGLVAVLGLILLVSSLAIIPGQDYDDSRIFRNHLLGLGLLLATVAVLAGAYRGPAMRRRAGRAEAG